MISRDLECLLIGKDVSVYDAIKAINNGAKQIVFVIDQAQRLLGTVTDGDIRRGMLQKIALEDCVQKVMNQKPLLLKHTEERERIVELMQKHSVHQIPVVDAEGHIIKLEFLDDLLKPKETEEIPVVLMAGGLGTRLHPLTQDTPKPMLPVGGRPLLENIVNNFVKQGYRRFYISVNYKAEIVQNHFGDGSAFNAEIQYIEENKRMGTAGALSLLPERPKTPIIVMNGDLLTAVNFNQLTKFHREHESLATMCARDYSIQVPYGVIETDGVYLKQIVEKPIHRFMVNSGIYVVSPEALDLIPHEEYFDMPQLFNKILENKSKASVFPIHEYWLDIGKFDDLEKAQNEFSEVFSE